MFLIHIENIAFLRDKRKEEEVTQDSVIRIVGDITTTIGSIAISSNYVEVSNSSKPLVSH